MTIVGPYVQVYGVVLLRICSHGSEPSSYEDSKNFVDENRFFQTELHRFLSYNNLLLSIR
jgi:hypothetical protein